MAAPMLFDVNSLSGTVLLAFVVVAILALGILKMMGPARPRTPAAPPPPPEPRAVSPAELARCTGLNGTPIYMAVKSPTSEEITVFDMTENGRDFYGPGGPYEVFAGKDASRGLAKMSTEEEDLVGDVNDLSADELDSLTAWYTKFITKYTRVGWLEVSGSAPSESVASAPEDKKND